MIKRKSSILVCFIGIDGSGKTTLCKRLQKAFTKNGTKCAYLQCRFVSQVMRLLIKIKDLILIREKDWKINFNRSKSLKGSLFKNRWFSFIYSSFILIGHCFQILHRLYLPLKRNRIVFCDRYIYDTVVDIAIEQTWSKNKSLKILEASLRFLPKPDLLFIIDIPEKAAFSRKDDIPSITHLSSRRYKYLTWFREHEPVILSGLESSKRLSDLATQLIESRLNI